MRRQNVHMLREFERLAKLRACMQVKVSTMLGLRGDYQERHVVLVPREPLPDPSPHVSAAASSAPRVIHSQLLIFRSHLAAVPECKLWTDGASMAREGDKWVLRLHQNHKRPVHVRLEMDSNGLFCISFKRSHHAGHEQQVDRLAAIVNETLAASLSHRDARRPAAAAGAAAAGPRAGGCCAAHASQPFSEAMAPVAASPAPSAPLRTTANGAGPSGSGTAAAAQLSDAEIAAQLQQSELVRARLTEGDLQAQMDKMGRGEASATVPPPAGAPGKATEVRSCCPNAAPVRCQSDAARPEQTPCCTC